MARKGLTPDDIAVIVQYLENETIPSGFDWHSLLKRIGDGLNNSNVSSLYFPKKRLLDSDGSLASGIEIHGRVLPVVTPPHGDFGLFRISKERLVAVLSPHGDKGLRILKLSLEDYMTSKPRLEGMESKVQIRNFTKFLNDSYFLPPMPAVLENILPSLFMELKCDLGQETPERVVPRVVKSTPRKRKVSLDAKSTSKKTKSVKISPARHQAHYPGTDVPTEQLFSESVDKFTGAIERQATIHHESMEGQATMHHESTEKLLERQTTLHHESTERLVGKHNESTERLVGKHDESTEKLLKRQATMHHESTERLLERQTTLHHESTERLVAKLASSFTSALATVTAQSESQRQRDQAAHQAAMAKAEAENAKLKAKIQKHEDLQKNQMKCMGKHLTKQVENNELIARMAFRSGRRSNPLPVARAVVMDTANGTSASDLSSASNRSSSNRRGGH